MESGEAAPDGIPAVGASTPVRRVLLVGFMGSGKTTVGRILAKRLGWAFVDFDERIEDRLGISVERIFLERGEDEFRRVEADVGRELLESEDVVLASGGGWPVGPGRLEDLPAGTLSVWLRVSAEEALRRVDRADAVRPLLERPDALAEARRLLEEREPYYRRAGLALDTEGRPAEALADSIEERVTS